MEPPGVRARIWIPVVIGLVAAAVRLVGLGSPPSTYWDEQYYVFDAAAYLNGGIGVPVSDPDPPPLTIRDEGTWVHPPLGKWAIALGVGPLGVHPLGWRLPSTAFGLAGVLLLYALGLELWGSPWWAGLAAGMLALDGLHIVQSRMATLDVFLTTWILAGIYLLVLDRTREGGQGGDWLSRVFGGGYRLGAGLCLGAAVATKWSGLLALAFAVIVCAAWSRRNEGARLRAKPHTFLTSFILAPLCVYLASYGSFWVQHGPAVGAFLTLQMRMLSHQLNHTQIQPENSAPWTWPLLLHPIRYFGPQAVSGGVREVLAVGNPALWWGFLILVPLAAVRVARRRMTWKDAVAWGGYLSMILPWLAAGRTQFIYYALPAVPFLCLAATAELRALGPTGVKVSLAWGCLIVAIALWFLPAWTATPVPAGWLTSLRLLSSWPGG